MRLSQLSYSTQTPSIFRTSTVIIINNNLINLLLLSLKEGDRVCVKYMITMITMITLREIGLTFDFGIFLFFLCVYAKWLTVKVLERYSEVGHGQMV